jgi:hypothetical protein
MDELLSSADEPPLAGKLDEHLDDVALHNEYRRLVAEQTALRRLGTLVARGVETVGGGPCGGRGNAPVPRCIHRRNMAI